jgi:hypothetical protein
MTKGDYPSAIEGFRFLTRRELPPVSTCWDFQTIEVLPTDSGRRLVSDLPEDCQISFFDSEHGGVEAWIQVRRTGPRYFVQRLRHGYFGPWAEQSFESVLASFLASPLVQKPAGSLPSFTVSSIPDHQRNEHAKKSAYGLVKMTKLRPSFADLVALTIWMTPGAMLVYVGYVSSWRLHYRIADHTGPEVWQQFEFGGGAICMALGLILCAVAIELFGRTVLIGEDKIESISPLRIFSQRLRRVDVGGARLTRVWGWGGVLEIRYGGKWIVFVSNTRFKKVVGSYIPLNEHS